MPTSVETLTRPLTVAECSDFIYQTLGVHGMNTKAWKPGAVVRTLILAAAILGAAFSRFQVALARSFSIGLSEGRWLTVVAKQVYGVERLKGTFATGELLASNAGGGIYHLDPGDLIVRSVDGREFRNTSAVTIGANDEDVVISIRAVEAGVSGGAAANTITLMTTPLAGVTVTNPRALQGTDPETDEQLRQRCRDSLALLSSCGPRDAYRFVVVSARRANGEPIGATRVKLVPDGYGNVTVYVATASGSIAGDAEDPDTDLGVIQRDIRNLVEPPGVSAFAVSASPKTIDVAYELWIEKSRFSDDELEARIERAIAAALAECPVGGLALPGSPNGVFKSWLSSVISQALREELALDVPVRVDVLTPSSDVPLLPHEAPALGEVTATIHQLVDDEEEGS